MNPALAALLSMALAGGGFALISLTMARHAGQALGGLPRRVRRQLAGVAGWVLLAASLACCVGPLGWGDGLVTWCGVLTLAALPLALGLGVVPRLALAGGPVAALGTAGLLAMLG